MARRTKRPRVIWFPQDTTFSVDSATDDESVYQRAVHDLTAINAGDSVTSIHPVTLDAPPVPSPLDQITLSDLENSGYRLRRIVGKVFCAVRIFTGAAFGPSPVICTAGYIVLRCDEAGLPLDTNIDRYSPNIVASCDSPWIWRRSWIVGNSFAPVLTGQMGFDINQSNNGRCAGSVMDGPHVDAKTARIVSKDTRLFLVLATTALSSGQNQILTTVDWVWEQRVLGTMRTSSGNRRNATR